MAKFEDAIEFVLRNEGGLADNLADPGGITNFGISFRFLRDRGIDLTGDGVVGPDDIRALTREKAEEIYRKYFWRYDQVASQRVATKVLDLDVNTGRGVKLLQRALNLVLAGPTAVDNAFGPKTLEFTNAADADVLVRALKAVAANYHRAVAAANPGLAWALNGWLARDERG